MKSLLVVCILFSITTAFGQTPCSPETQVASAQDGTELLISARRILSPLDIGDASIAGTTEINGKVQTFRLLWSKGRFRFDGGSPSIPRTLLFRNGELIELRSGSIHSRSWNFDGELLAPFLPIMWLQQRLQGVGITRSTATDPKTAGALCINESEVIDMAVKKVAIKHVWELDSQTALVRSVQYSLPRREDASSRTIERVEYSDYSNFTGLLMPRKIAIFAEGAFVERVSISDVKLNSGISDSEFDLPGSAK